jgi:glycosyltransferase involved in cell wall biosynthesis
MRILIVNKYFHPDQSSSAQIIKSLSENFIRSGHKIDVVAGNSFYRLNESKKYRSLKINNKINTNRIDLTAENNSLIIQAINALKLGLYASYFLIKKKYNLIIVTTMPPLITAFVITLVAKFKKIKLIYYCMDIYPEVATISGNLKNRYLFKILQYLDTTICIYAKYILVNSRDMLKTLANRPSGNLFKIEIFNNIYTRIPSCPISCYSRQNYSKSKLSVVFTGNLGRFQNLDLVLNIFKLVEKNKTQLVFVGDGVMYEHLKKRVLVEKINAVFVGHKSPEIANQFIRYADICLISLSSGVINYSYPSKTLSYLWYGKPILALVDKNSELSSMILDRKIGFVLDYKNPTYSASIISKIAKDRTLLVECQINAKKVFNDLFADKIIFSKWNELIKNLQ